MLLPASSAIVSLKLWSEDFATKLERSKLPQLVRSKLSAAKSPIPFFIGPYYKHLLPYSQKKRSRMSTRLLKESLIYFPSSTSSGSSEVVTSPLTGSALAA